MHNPAEPQPGLSVETHQIIDGLPEPLADAAALDRLVVGLKGAGIWGATGKISWARDAGAGILILWEPS